MDQPDDTSRDNRESDTDQHSHEEPGDTNGEKSTKLIKTISQRSEPDTYDISHDDAD